MERSPRCLVVMYHYVRNAPDSGASTWGAHPGVVGLTPAEFERQIDRLCAHFEPVDWPTFYAWNCGRASIPERAFLLTFDDGLMDHAATAAPILESRGLRGVFFIPGAILTEHRMLSAHAVHLLLSTLGADRLGEEITRSIAEDGYAETPLTESEEKAAEAMYHYETRSIARLKYTLTIKLPADVRSRAVERLFEEHVGSSARWARHWYLGWDDLSRLESAGHTIGGHGFRHEAYRRWSDAEARRDIRRVAAVLREGLGPDKRPFSYPFGSVPAGCDAMCGEAGFVQAFTTEQAWTVRRVDPYQIPRIDTIAVESAIAAEVRDSEFLPWSQACST